MCSWSVDVPVANQKLFVPKKALQTAASSTLIKGLLQQKKVTRIKVLGATRIEKERFADYINKGSEMASKLRIRDDLTSRSTSRNRQTVGRNLKNQRKQRRRRDKPEYRFDKIKALPGFTDKRRAKQILTKLASDPGILHVLKEYKWKIPLLSEMYPEGKVGISAVCVLGLNVGNGREIRLRIRTDDLTGFRKYSSMLKVLCHELAHNHFSEHDERFYLFMREIQKKVEENNWKRGEGKTIGGMEAKYRPNLLGDDLSDVSFSDSSLSGGEGEVAMFSGAGVKVGTKNAEEFDGLNLREKAALAAKKRMQREAQSKTMLEDEETKPPDRK